MAGRGLSYDEKRTRMLEYFHEEKAVFNLKELESKLRKAKGIVQQSVKEILYSLIYDDLVKTDKIGSGNFFWSFPSENFKTRENILQKAESALEAATEQRDNLLKEKEELLKDREDTDERKAKLQRLQELRAEEAKLDAELSKFSASDPERIQKLTKLTAEVKEAANRETTNIELLLSYFKNRRPEISAADFYQHFGLPKDLEELE